MSEEKIKVEEETVESAGGQEALSPEQLNEVAGGGAAAHEDAQKQHI